MAPTFLADGMLGSLARKLRLYGYDVEYHPDMPDSELISRCVAEKRTLLTSDRELGRRATAKGLPCVLVTQRGDPAMVVEVFRALGLAPPMDVSSSRCPLCGGELANLAANQAKGLVPAGVLRRQKRFYRCVSCQHVYWEGSHWFRLSRFDDQVKKALGK